MLTRTDIILRALVRLQPATRAQIAEATGLEPEIVGHAVQNLKRQKKVRHGEPTHQTLSTGQEVEVVTWIALVEPPEEPRTEDGICGPIVAQALARRCALHQAWWAGRPQIGPLGDFSGAAVHPGDSGAGNAAGGRGC